MKVFASKGKPPPPSKQEVEVDGALLAQLKQLRKRQADRLGVPAYVVFTDATLRDMCAKKPTSLEEMREISGVGAIKLQRFGEMLLTEIRNYAGQGEKDGTINFYSSPGISWRHGKRVSAWILRNVRALAHPVKTGGTGDSG